MTPRHLHVDQVDAVAIAAEIARIESQQPPLAMGQHGRHDVGVVNLATDAEGFRTVAYSIQVRHRDAMMRRGDKADCDQNIGVDKHPRSAAVRAIELVAAHGELLRP